ncbi:acylase [Glaciecola sp. 1036]|uniref:acylase n=1 Tax=Alteromonadaceae TaxID=72275 RepID=UPI003D073198
MHNNKFFDLRIMCYLICALLLISCGGNDNDFSDVERPTPPAPPTPEPPPATVTAFDPDGVLQADIRYTQYGVPHIVADNLESMSYGVGYAAAKDNICIIADQAIRFNSQRAKYLGPDANPGSGDSAHVINDFAYLTIGIREIAEDNFAAMSANTRALISGYTKGYNRYLADTGLANIDPSCANQPWVKPIDEIDHFTILLGIALLPGAANFESAIFAAAPPGVDFRPRQLSIEGSKLKFDPAKMDLSVPQVNPDELGSNGWGLGSDKTENGMGMVLANPHFPFTGNLRFWQFHTTIPGFLNVIGGSLVGTPGIVNIGFNENLAWTHTFSTAEHFVVYQLTLDEDDANGLTHLVDGQRRTIYKKTMKIDVAVGPGVSIELEKDGYYTNYGPMINVPGNFEWGPNDSAFAIKDVNLPNFDIVDHWLGMNLATNMDEFKQAFQQYDGVIFNNTMAASRSGEVFYIDDSTVPNLTSTAMDQLVNNPQLSQIRQLAGFTVLPGFASVFDFNGPVPYEQAPKYSGTDYVQNSNDSFWLTNLDNPITGVSPLYGRVGNQQTLRSRHGQLLIQQAAGSDGLFSPTEVEEALLANKSLLADLVLNDLVSQCAANGANPVDVNGTNVDISQACGVLNNWDGTMNVDSVGAHIFREFAFAFGRNWVNDFDVNDPVNTPNGLVDNQQTLVELAQAVKNIQDAGIALDANFGQVQFVEKSDGNGNPDDERLPWPGSHNVEGGFNVFRPANSNNGTTIPRHTYPTLANSELSAAAPGYHINYGSSWMMVVNFTEAGHDARGILSYSQSTNSESDSFNDQSRVYSETSRLRPIHFTEAQISANLVSEMQLDSSQE